MKKANDHNKEGFSLVLALCTTYYCVANALKHLELVLLML